MKNYITFEQAKKLFENNDNPQEVIDSIWERHWKNAKTTNDIQVLNNLLSNHIRLLNNLPERNNGRERENIISYLQNKLNILVA